jgi:hypothetical protein
VRAEPFDGRKLLQRLLREADLIAVADDGDGPHAGGVVVYTREAPPTVVRPITASAGANAATPES